jgi:calcineurin-like phosphoesterase
VQQMRTGMPIRFRTAKDGVRLEGVLVECGDDGRATRCDLVRVELPPPEGQ